MINRIFGDNSETVAAVMGALNKTISFLGVAGNELKMEFTDGTGIKFFDDGQSCCEHRYMDSGDDLPAFIGAKFTGARIASGPGEEDEYGQEKESQFLIIETSMGSFTVVNYNEHNGYYGGFDLEVRPLDLPPQEKDEGD